MSLNVVLGKSNTGKSEYIFKEIMACEAKGKQAILFVPPSGRVQAEEEYLKYTNKKALIDTKISSIERFVSQNIDKNELYKEKTFLPKLAKKMLVKKVISENPDLFNIFLKVKGTTGFADTITEYMLKFSDLKVNEELEKYTEQDFLRSKLDEFLKIYNKLEEELKSKFITSTDEMNYYINKLNESKTSLKLNVYVDNYNNFNDVEYLFIQALLLNGNAVTITLDLDKEKYLEGITSIYDTSYDTLRRLKEICNKNKIAFNFINMEKAKKNRPEDIEFLANHLMDNNRNSFEKKSTNVKLILKSNVYEEIKYVTNDILQKVRDGYKFQEIVVYTNNIETYFIPIKRLFNLCKIPVHIKEESSLVANDVIVYLIGMLKMVSQGIGKDADQVINLLKTGMLDVTEDEVAVFENYIMEFGIKGYSVLDKFTMNSTYDLEKINKTREVFVQRLSSLKNELKNIKETKKITEVIYLHLNKFGIIEKYESNLKYIEKVDLNEYNKAKQILVKLYEILDNIVIAYEKISLQDYINLLEYGIKDAKIDTIPAKLNEVEVLDINNNRGTEKKIAYIIGCYDGGLPTVQQEDNIFTDIELEKLKSFNIELKQTAEERNNMQLFNIYQALNKVREKIIFTVPASTTNGAALRPSNMIQSVKQLLNISLDNFNNEDLLSTNQYFMEFMTELSKIDENADKEIVERNYINYLLYKDKEEYSNIMKYLRKDANLNENTLDKIYKSKIDSSISRLEQFKRCPFSYYATYVLKLKERKKFVMSSLDTGSLMHEVIEKFSKFVVAKNINWQDIVINEKVKKMSLETINNIVDKIFEEKYEKYLTSARYIILKTKLKKAMEKTILAIADSFNHSEFRPLGYEIEFENDTLFTPIEVELDNGNKLYLRGKIDRVDSCKVDNNTYLRIVDYKSSEKNLKLSDIKSGISLQLMTYMCAMLENNDKIDKETKIIPAALSYFTISNKILNISNYEKNDAKISEKLKKALKLRGIYIKDVEVLHKLDNNMEDSKNSYLEVSNRSINNVEKVLPEAVFIEECKNIGNILKQIGSEITSGVVKICPNNISNVCEYCKYSTVCRKDILN